MKFIIWSLGAQCKAQIKPHNHLILTIWKNIFMKTSISITMCHSKIPQQNMVVQNKPELQEKIRNKAKYE
jgi:hypothetical protein